MYTIICTTERESGSSTVCADGCCWTLHECAAGSGKPSPHTQCDELQSQRPVNLRHGVVIPDELSLSLSQPPPYEGSTLRRKHDAASHSRKLEFANVNVGANMKIIRWHP